MEERARLDGCAQGFEARDEPTSNHRKRLGVVRARLDRSLVSVIARWTAWWLALPEGQGSRAARMLALVFVASMALAQVKAVQSGLFLAVCSRAEIPMAFAVSSVALAALAAALVLLSRRFDVVRVGETVLVSSMLGLVVLRVSASLFRGSSAMAFSSYVVLEGLSGVLVIQVWSVAAAATDARTAPRLLPVAGIGSGIAWAISGLAVGPLARAVGAESLLLGAALTLLAAFGLTRAMGRLDVSARASVGRGIGMRGGLVSSLRFIARVPLLRLVTALSLLALVTEEIMDFHLMAVAREEIAGSAALAGFFGRYYAVTSAIGTVLLAGPAARVFGRLGAVRALAVTPFVTLLAALVAVMVPGLTSAVMLRGVARVLKQTLWSTSQEQLHAPIGHARRAETRMTIRGVLAPAGYAAVALGLAELPEHLDDRWLAAVTVVLAATTLALVLAWARPSYVRALQRAVDERRLSLGSERVRREMEVDADAASVLAAEVLSEEPERAALAVEVLSGADQRLARGPLVEALRHPVSSVRRAAAEALGRIGDDADVVPIVVALERERESEVRAALATALGATTARNPDAGAEDVVAPLLGRASTEAEPRVRAALAVLAARRGRQGAALGEALLPLLGDEQVEVRRAALGALTRAAFGATGVTEAVRRCLTLGEADEPVAAAERIVALGVVPLLPDVIALLRDARIGPRVARALVALEANSTASDPPTATSTLASITLVAQRIASGRARGATLARKLLSHRDPRIRRSAVQAYVEAIRSGTRCPLPGPEVAPLLVAELRGAYRLVALQAALDAYRESNDAVAALRVEVHLCLEQRRADVLGVLSLAAEFGRRGSRGELLDAIEAARRVRSSERDAQIAELLEQVLDELPLGPARDPRGLRRAFVALFEFSWPRSLLNHASEVVEDLGIEPRADPFDLVLATEDPHLRRMAAAAFPEEYERRYPNPDEEERAMLPRFERLRSLRRVPLFASLPGDDLVSVAAVLDEVELDAGEFVFRRGDRGEELYIVVSGRVEIGEQGRVIATLGEAEFFGDLAVLDQEGRSADARAVEPTTLLRLRGADLRELMASRPEITLGIVRVLVARLRAASERLSG